MYLNLNNLFNLETININDVQNVCVKLYIKSKVIEFQEDTGADVLIMPRRKL